MLDVKTLILCAALTNYYMCGGLYVYSKSQKTYPGFGYWMTATVMVAITYTLFMMRGILPDWLTIPVANAIVMTSAVFRIEGMKKFVGRGKFNYWSFWMPALLFVWHSYFTFVNDNIAIRNAMFTVLTIIIAVWLIVLLLSNPWAEKKAITNYFIGIIVVYSFFLIVRAVGMFSEGADQTLTANTSFNSVYFLVVLFFDISWSVCFILLNGQRMETEIKSLTAQLDALASIDPLTGAYNRRKLLELGELELERAKRYAHPLSLLIFDLDRFKNVNDTYGHVAGDNVLRVVIQACRNNLRRSDVLARFGGDEFVVLMPETDAQKAVEIVERLSNEIRSVTFEFAPDLVVSLSYGVVELSSDDINIDNLVARADRLLYSMKNERRALHLH